MKLEIQWTPRADRDRERVDPASRARILVALERYAETGHGDAKRLRGYEPVTYRLRVGPWRVMFTVDHSEGLLAVVRVLPRREAYRQAVGSPPPMSTLLLGVHLTTSSVVETVSGRGNALRLAEAQGGWGVRRLRAPPRFAVG